MTSPALINLTSTTDPPRTDPSQVSLSPVATPRLSSCTPPNVILLHPSPPPTPACLQPNALDSPPPLPFFFNHPPRCLSPSPSSSLPLLFFSRRDVSTPPHPPHPLSRCKVCKWTPPLGPQRWGGNSSRERGKEGGSISDGGRRRGQCAVLTGRPRL